MRKHFPIDKRRRRNLGPLKVRKVGPTKKKPSRVYTGPGSKVRQASLKEPIEAASASEQGLAGDAEPNQPAISAAGDK